MPNRKHLAHVAREPETNPLDAIFKRRFHGQSNIRGIRYQMLYSALRTFDLATGDVAYVKLEGIEDLDLVGIRVPSDYIQVKTAQDNWSWSDLKKPVQGFLEVLRVDKGCRFALVVNFPLRDDMERLARFQSLGRKEQERVGQKFVNLCKQVGASVEEGSSLLTRIQITSLPLQQVMNDLRVATADAFHVESGAVDLYLATLVQQCLTWAAERKAVTRQDIDQLVLGVRESMARETAFAAYGRGLVDTVHWEPDGAPDDFIAGKATRPGHIAADLDIPRPAWQKRIDQALHTAGVCVIRSSSGQGKSTLLYRYARDSWHAGATLVLRAAPDEATAELICQYLRFRAGLGLPLLLVIDGADARQREWPTVVRECAALSVRVLLAVRNEDWFRFSRTASFNYEVVEPALSLEEAREVFQALRGRKRLHPTVSSADLAYDRLQNPKLLMEYVYLLTHGQMLADRLRDQIQGMRDLGEDPAKLELLRRVTLAHTLGTPLDLHRLGGTVPFRDDPQQVIRSLESEYIAVADGAVTGLHAVRSAHLADLLHEAYHNPAQTALASLDAVPTGDVTAFVAAAALDGRIDHGRFLAGLEERVRNGGRVSELVAFLEGVFEAGERIFFEANRALFDETFALVGTSGPFLLAAELNPTLTLTGTLFGGYSSTLFYLLWRFSREVRLEFGYREEGKWIGRCGIVERITKKDPDAYSDDGRHSKRRGYLTRTIEKPGVSPAVLFHLIGNTVFLRLADVAQNLPSYTERVVLLPLDRGENGGEPSQASCYQRLAADLRQAVLSALHEGSKRLLATYLQALLSYPDAATKGETVVDPLTMSVIASAPALPDGVLYPKEQALVELVRRERARGRRVLLFITHTETRDISPRVRTILEREGFRVAVLKAGTVAADRREEWLNARVREGAEVLVCHPRLVQTGLDYEE